LEIGYQQRAAGKVHQPGRWKPYFRSRLLLSRQDFRKDFGRTKGG